GNFFVNGGPARAPDHDAPGRQLPDYGAAPGHLQGLVPAHLPAGPVAGAAEGLGEGFFGPYQDERVTPHVAGNQHRLPRLLIGRRGLRVVRREGPGRPLAVDAEPLPDTPSHFMSLDL